MKPSQGLGVGPIPTTRSKTDGPVDQLAGVTSLKTRAVLGSNPAGATNFCGYSSVAEWNFSKVQTWVRFPLSAPKFSEGFGLSVWETNHNKPKSLT